MTKGRMRLWFLPGFKISSHLGRLWHAPDNGVEDFCINHLNSDTMMMQFWRTREVLGIAQGHTSQGRAEMQTEVIALMPFSRQLLSGPAEQAAPMRGGAGGGRSTWGLHTCAPVSSALHFSPLPCADFAFVGIKASYLDTCHSQSRISSK